jgi:hypothetical protein
MGVGWYILFVIIQFKMDEIFSLLEHDLFSWLQRSEEIK